ncbi:MAG: DUF3667 domain-containing protein [Acidobacteriota bacterium]
MTEAPSCPTCGTARPDRFCPSCGEAALQDGEPSLRQVVVAFFSDVTNLEGKLWRTLWSLVRHPGQLAADWSRGKRRPYMKPTQVLILATVVYFLLQAFTPANTLNQDLAGHVTRQVYSPLAHGLTERRLDTLTDRAVSELPAAEAHDETVRERIRATVRADYTTRFDDRVAKNARALVFLLAPLLALVFAVVHLDGGRGAAEHLVLAAHFVSFLLIVVLVIGATLVGITAAVLISLFGLGNAPRLEWLVAQLLAVPCLLWLHVAYRTFHENTRLSAALRAGVTVLAVLPAVMVLRLLTFLFTHATLGPS